MLFSLFKTDMVPKKDPRPDRYVYLHETDKLAGLLSSLHLLGSKQDEQEKAVEQEQLEEEEHEVKQEQKGSMEALSCSSCQLKFDNVGDQRLHFKLDLHRYNIKQGLKGR